VIGTPFVAGSASSAASSATYQVPVTVPVPPGAVAVVFAGAAGTLAAVSVADTQGNVYAAGPSASTVEYLQSFAATAVTGLNPLNGDYWTVTFAAANTLNKNMIAVAVTGVTAADISATAAGFSAAPSVTGTATSGDEIAIAAMQNAAVGGVPASESFSPLLTLAPAGQQYTTAAYGLVTRAGAASQSWAITFTAWAAVMVSLTASPPAALGAGASPQGGAQLPPYPVLPSPRTWAPGDELLTSRLRADPGNALLLLANPPLFIGSQTVTGQSVATATDVPLELDTEATDTWQSHGIPAAAVTPPLAGWYLAEGMASINDTVTATTAGTGIQAVQGGITSLADGGRVAPNGANNPLPACADLVQVNPATGDTLALYAFQVSGATKTVASAWLKSEWVCAPSGTLVTSPVPAAGWTSGATTLLAAVSAGATEVFVADPTGIVTGGTIALDQGNSVAEAVAVTSVSGQTVGIGACSWPHAASAPVAVPVSAAFLNQQVRDKISFLAYRPIARLTSQGASQSLPSQAWPAGTAVAWGSPATSGARCTDNFSGWSSANPTRYVFPVSGTYYLHGQVYCTDAASPFVLSAGLAISGGTIQWGDRTETAGTSTSACATVRRAAVRVAAGQYAEAYGCQGSGGSLALKNSGNAFCKFLAVWRGF
jgi:hypothetical protein